MTVLALYQRYPAARDGEYHRSSYQCSTPLERKPQKGLIISQVYIDVSFCQDSFRLGVSF